MTKECDYVFAWQIKPTEINSGWIVINPKGNTKRFVDKLSLTQSLQHRSATMVYTNSAALHEKDINPKRLRCLDMTPFEYRYFFSLIEAWLPDYSDESIVIEGEKVHGSLKELMPLVNWLHRYHQHFESIHSQLSLSEQTFAMPGGNFEKMAAWLSREQCRLFPQGAVMDKHVYCSRWSATHWSDYLQVGIIQQEPRRDPALLKTCRHDPLRATKIESPAFLLVYFTSCKVEVDWPLKQSVWISNAELNAIMDSDPKAKFDIEDIFIISITPLPSQSFFDDPTYQLSITHGMVCRHIVTSIEGTWTMAWWRSLERAKWLSLILTTQRQFQLAVSAYGNGYLSFYCWSGEMARICQFLKVRAAVLKQSDRDYDAEFKQELTWLVDNNAVEETNEPKPSETATFSTR